MKGTRMFAIWIMVLGLMACPAKFVGAAPMGTAFTYQGRLMDRKKPANNIYDFQFGLFDDWDPNIGVQVGDILEANDVDVVDGHFTLALDFGSDVFDGNAVWLETSVRPGDSSDVNDFVTLVPRQEITPVPYALQTRGIFVDPNGNVGIGTTLPSEKLEVNGDVKVNNITLGNSDIDDKGSIRMIIDRDNNQTNQTFSVWTDGKTSPPGAELFRIQENGNVGIGTTNPIYELDVSGDIRATGTIHGTATNADGVDGYDAGNSSGQVPVSNGTMCTNLNADMLDGYHYDGLPYIGGSGSVNYIPTFTAGKTLSNSTIYQSGNKVGIGTTAPEAELHVQGGVRVAGPLNMSNNKITNVASPTSSSDAATKGYVDALTGSIIKSIQRGEVFLGNAIVGSRTVNIYPVNTAKSFLIVTATGETAGGNGAILSTTATFISASQIRIWWSAGYTQYYRCHWQVIEYN